MTQKAFGIDFSSHSVWQRAMTHPDLMANIATAAVIMLITIVISRLVANAVRKVARRMAQTDADRTLPEFLSQVVRWMLLTVGCVAAMNRLGVETASFVTVLGAASLSIGLALQGTLGNVASGLMILFTKPYRIGDSVRIGDTSGRVHRLGLFNTEIDNVENIRVYVPNSKIFSNDIGNISTNGALKLELKVDIGYEADLEATLKLLADVARAQPDHIQTHEVWTGFQEFAASGITVRMWIWVLPANALNARSRWMIDVKRALDGAGVDIPYPHQVAIEKVSGPA
ncbi:mechanosensitive ion channel family protein [Asticcacaulis solisilvae]|uniref:mechanosensitive ion channel family protein n=1 Tax=Asticcacaulis solisilvae TaxID=1217274 RepID=UPI003FD83F91